MNLIGRYRNVGFESVADAVNEFYLRRDDLRRSGVAFGDTNEDGPAKVSTDISLVAIDHSDVESFGLAQLIMKGVNAGLERYLQERPLFRYCCPDQDLFVNPIFNLQYYASGEGFKRWHCDWTISYDATEPVHRVLAWILYCNDVEEAGTEFHWQSHHEPAEKGKLLIFPAGPSHIHRGRVNMRKPKLIATGWINGGREDDYLRRLAS